MIAANDIDGRSEEIENLIAADNVGQAARRLMDFVSDFSQNREYRQEVIVISSTYSGLERRERQGLLDYEQADKHRRHLLFQILGLIEAIRNELALGIMAA